MDYESDLGNDHDDFSTSNTSKVHQTTLTAARSTQKQTTSILRPRQRVKTRYAN